MWFRVLSLVIATALVGKAIIALAARRRFYAERQRQYASAALPSKLLIPPIVVVAITLAACYASAFHYRPWSWIVTGALTVLSVMAVDHVFRWERHRQAMLKVVANPKVWQIDCLLLAAGLAFFTLAVMIY